MRRHHIQPLLVTRFVQQRPSYSSVLHVSPLRTLFSRLAHASAISPAVRGLKLAVAPKSCSRPHRLSKLKSGFGTDAACQRFFVLSSTVKSKSPKLSLEAAGNSPINYNENITEVLEGLAQAEKLKGDVYRERAYRNAINAIRQYPSMIKSGAQAKELKSVGASIARKIDEILETGTCRELEKARSSESETLRLFQRVLMIGPVAAQKFVDKGYTTLEELINDPGLTSAQKLGIRYLHEFEHRIPRDEIKKFEGRIKETLDELDPKYVGTICGSFRRGRPDSGDLDILITHPQYTSLAQSDPGDRLQKVIDRLSEKGVLTDHISCGLLKYMGVCQLPGDDSALHRRIDVRLMLHDRYWLGVLAMTGDDEFNRHMRKQALDMGFQLSEHILAWRDPMTGKLGEPEKITSEKDVFDVLGLPYLEPEKRNFRTEPGKFHKPFRPGLEY